MSRFKIWQRVVEWRSVPGFSSYEVNNIGEVISFRKGVRIMKPHDHKGYKSLHLFNKPYQRKKLRVHQIVALAFIPNPENKPCINHINGIKDDNRVENLEWCTYSENTKHVLLTGLHPTIPTTSRSVIDLNTNHIYPTILEAAKSFSISPYYMSCMLSGKKKNKINCEYYNPI